MGHLDTRGLAPEACLVRPAGRLDCESIVPVAAALERELKRGRLILVIDLAAVTELTPGALGGLLLVQTAAEAQGSHLAFAGASEQVLQVVKAHAFQDVFPVYDSPVSAVSRSKEPDAA